MNFFPYILNYTNKRYNFSLIFSSKLFYSSIILAGMACSPQLILLENKPEWAEDGFVYYINSIEKKLGKKPKDSELLSKGCEVWTKYTYGFIMEKADRIIMEDYKGGKTLYAQANKNFTKAVSYGEKSLSIKFPNYNSWVSDKSKQSPHFTEVDLPNLFWTAAAYGGAISSSRANPEWVILLPRVGYLLETALKIKPEWSKGALYGAMISYSMNRHDAKGDKVEIAREYFDKAIKSSNGLDLSPYVTFAESVSIPMQNRNEFTNLIYKALNLDIKSDPDLRLTNHIARKRAEWLLDNIDEFFY